MPRYDVLLSAPLAELAEPIRPGEPIPELFDAWWSGDAESPETAVEAARAVWRQKYGQAPPADAQVKVTIGPDVCPRCEGRKWIERYVPLGLVGRGDDAELGSARKRTCPDCAGKGNRR